MPTHCCVPGCVKKGYSDEDGNKVSYFIFPVEKGLRKKWIHAIRRDEGKDFQIKPTTKVCSRHFRENDIKKNPRRQIPAVTWSCSFAVLMDVHFSPKTQSTDIQRMWRSEYSVIRSK